MLVRNAIWNYGGAVADFAVGALLLALVTRHLPPAEFGVLVLVVSLVQLLLLVDGGVLAVLTPACVQVKREHGTKGLCRFIGTVLTLGLLMGTVLGALFVVVGNMLTRTLHSTVFANGDATLLLSVLFFVPALFASSVATRALESLQEYRTISTAQMTTAIVRLAFVLFAVSKNGGVGSIVAAYAATASLLALLRLWALRSRIGAAIPLTLSDWRSVRALWRTSRFAALDTLARQTTFGTDALVLAVFAPVSSLAWLGVAQKIPFAIWMGIERLAAVTLAPMTQLHLDRRNADVRNIFLNTSRLLFAVVFPVVLAFGFAARGIVRIWAGPSYVPAGSAMQWLLVTVLLLSLSVPAIVLLYAVGKIHVSARLALFEGAANLLLSVILAPRFGASGVAFATAFTHAVVTVFFLLPGACAAVELPAYQYARQIGGDVALPAAALGSVLLLIAAWPTLPFSFIAGGLVIGALLYSGLWYYRVGMNMSLKGYRFGFVSK